jgi:prephenate dehydratase
MITFGIAGDQGSFSEEAALKYAQKAGFNPSLVYLIDMEGVLAALERGDVQQGIFPVVNLIGGLVKPAFKAMGKHLFTPVDELWLEIQQCLLVQPGMRLQQIKNIVSHPQGLLQCENYLKKTFKSVDKLQWIDTAKAARDLAAGHLPPFSAVIAPEHSAQVYGLEVLEKNIQDKTPNLTAFIIAKQYEAGEP